MTSDNVEESVERLELPCLAPDAERARGTRARCHAVLARNRRRAARTAATPGFAQRVLVPAAVGGFCVLYAAALVATTLRLQGVLD